MRSCTGISEYLTYPCRPVSYDSDFQWFFPTVGFCLNDIHLHEMNYENDDDIVPINFICSLNGS